MGCDFHLLVAWQSPGAGQALGNMYFLLFWGDCEKRMKGHHVPLFIRKTKVSLLTLLWGL